MDKTLEIDEFFEKYPIAGLLIEIDESIDIGEDLVATTLLKSLRAKVKLAIKKQIEIWEEGKYEGNNGFYYGVESCIKDLKGER